MERGGFVYGKARAQGKGWSWTLCITRFGERHSTAFTEVLVGPGDQ